MERAGMGCPTTEFINPVGEIAENQFAETYED